mmetsp:Transcript_6764/g.28400  ORF Transcript_6764/g.28400 Transcript_6764/m.28400 type:complete len:230 (+) Transcript_6764:1568-2257(+)
MTAGGWAARLMSATPSPMVAASSLCTTDTSTWPGFSEPTTSWPSAFSLTRAMKSRTTGRATSASSRAMRTSRSMSCTLLSVMRAWPRIVLTRRLRRSVRVEAIEWGGPGPQSRDRPKVHCGHEFIARPPRRRWRRCARRRAGSRTRGGQWPGTAGLCLGRPAARGCRRGRPCGRSPAAFGAPNGPGLDGPIRGALCRHQWLRPGHARCTLWVCACAVDDDLAGADGLSG